MWAMLQCQVVLMVAPEFGWRGVRAWLQGCMPRRPALLLCTHLAPFLRMALARPSKVYYYYCDNCCCFYDFLVLICN